LCIHYFDLPSAKPLNDAAFVSTLSVLIILFSSSILDKISKASNIANFFEAAAFFNLSAAISGAKPSKSFFNIPSLATFISSFTAFFHALIISNFKSVLFIIKIIKHY